MLMRYHWGLGIGHIYTHEHYSHPSHSILADSDLIEPQADDTSEEQTNDPDLHPMDDENDNGGPMEVDDPELGLEERDKEPELEWDSESEFGRNEDELSDIEISDEELELHSTYEIDY
jgi:hypothetical protein